MGILDGLGDKLDKSFGRDAVEAIPDVSSLAEMAGANYAMQVESLRASAERVNKGEGSDIDRLLVDTMGRASAQNSGSLWKSDTRLQSALGENVSGYIGINDYGFKGKRQYIADRRYLLDLYVVGYNNADIRTAITHQRNEIFRRGFDWEQKYDFRCSVCDNEYTMIEARKKEFKCEHKVRAGEEANIVGVPLEKPDDDQKVDFDKFIKSCNYFGQSLETVLRECWDDINICDDAFIFVSKEYTATRVEDEDGNPTEEWELTGKPIFIFRLDPVLVEFDLDQRGIPGMRHHICLLHRDNLLEVPPGEGWELDWQGKCPECGLPTYPTLFKYNESYLQGGYGPYAEDTEILTRSGWKYWQELDYTHEIATLSPLGEMEWQHPSDIVAQDYTGPMYHLNHKRADLLVHPDHNIFAQFSKDAVTKQDLSQFEIKTAKEAAGYYMGFLKADAEWAGQEQYLVNIPAYTYYHRSGAVHGRDGRVVSGDAWFEFMGYYLAEGATTLTRNGRSGHVKIAQSRQAHPETFNRIDKCLSRMGFDYTVRDDGFHIYDTQLVRCLFWLGKSADKYAPQYIKEGSMRQLRLFFDAYIAGDGMQHNVEDSWRCWTTSTRLVDDLMEIGLKLGYTPAHLSTKAAKNENSHDTYCLSFSHRPIRWMRGQWETEDYDGKIWCVTVPNKVVYVRRNGRAVWCGNTAQAKVLYLTADEVIHWSYFTPSELYGYPPILSIYEKALTLIGMDRYIYDYFYERKVPQGIISTVTDDPRGIESVKSELQARMQQDPHYIPWIAVSAKTGAGKTEFVRFAYTLDELNYLPVRDEIRERISGIYGVSSIWMSSMVGVGGLNAESQQLQVMSRVVEGAQRVFHEQVFPALLNHFGITDWELKLATPEEESELAELEIKQSKATHAQTMAAIGFGVEYDQDTDEFIFTGKVPSMEEQMQMQQEMGAIGQEGGPDGGAPMPGSGQPQGGDQPEAGKPEPPVVEQPR